MVRPNKRGFSFQYSHLFIDRALSLYWSQWKQSYGRIKYTNYYIAILTTICILLNGHILFLNGYRTSSGIITCYATRSNPGYIYPQWQRVHLAVYNLCPFAVMCICNTYIIYVTVRSGRAQIESTLKGARRKSMERYWQFTALLIIVTFAFVLLTLPACIYFVFFRNDLASKSERNYRFMIQILLNSIQFTSHAINFFLYCFSADSFRHELYAMFQIILSNTRWCYRSNKEQNERKRRYDTRNYPKRIYGRQQQQRQFNRDPPNSHYQLQFFPEFQSSIATRINGL